MAENLKVNDYHAIPVGFKKKTENNLYNTINPRIPRDNPMSCIWFCDKTVYCHAETKQKQINDRTNLAPTPVPYLAV